MMAVSCSFASGSEMVLPILDQNNCACLQETLAKPGLLTSLPERTGGSQISLAQGVMHNFSGRSKSLFLILLSFIFMCIGIKVSDPL